MIFIDPSELRENSNLRRHISDVVYKTLPELEAITGADVMISPDGLPFPRNESLVKLHIDSGCKLIQIKFGHDLPQSVADGRLNEQLARMITIGASQWQCVLLAIGLFGYENTRQLITINGQLSYGQSPMKWIAVDSKMLFWTESGGVLDWPLPSASGKLIANRFAIHQKHINDYRSGKTERVIFPKKSTFYKEIKPTNPTLKKLPVPRKLIIVDDIRLLICAIPGVRIGEGKATAILEYMAENSIRQDFNGFLQIVHDERILNVKGIGKKLLADVRSGLFETYEERSKQNAR